MLDKTLGYILCCQSPGLFLAAAVLVIAYFAGRKKHRFKAVLKLLLAIVCAVGAIALYYLGMYDEYFTIRDFYQIRPAGWVGVGIAAFFTLLALVRAFFAAADARREEKAANRAENQRRRPLPPRLRHGRTPVRSRWSRRRKPFPQWTSLPRRMHRL